MDRSSTLCFTGHRVLQKEERDYCVDRLPLFIRTFMKYGITDFVAGGAVGFDTLAAKAVLKEREQSPFLTLTVISPFAGQAYNFSDEEKEDFLYIKNLCNRFIVLNDRYYNGCMQERNRKMVDMSSVCLAFLKNPHSGSGYTVRYAREKGVRVINLYKEEKIYGQKSIF